MQLSMVGSDYKAQTYRGKNKQRIRKVKKKLKENPIVECNKIQNSYYPNLFSKFI